MEKTTLQMLILAAAIVAPGLVSHKVDITRVKHVESLRVEDLAATLRPSDYCISQTLRPSDYCISETLTQGKLS